VREQLDRAEAERQAALNDIHARTRNALIERDQLFVLGLVTLEEGNDQVASASGTALKSDR
jgi:hypothetical protein